MTFRVLLAAPFALCVVFTSAQSPKMIDRIVEEGRDHSQVVSLLRHLTKNIGPRTTGTPELDQAQSFVMNKLIEWGCSNVRLEKFGEFDVRFRRGDRASARMFIGPAPVEWYNLRWTERPSVGPISDWFSEVPKRSEFRVPGLGMADLRPTVEVPTDLRRWLPWQKEIQFSTPSWSPGTDGPVRGPAILEPQSTAELEAIRNRLKGAWIVMRDSTGMRGPRPTQSPLATMLDEAGIAGRVYNTGSDLIWTHGQPGDAKDGQLPTQVLISISRPDYKIIRQHLAAGSDIQLEFDIENVFTRGPMPLFNVMGDIVGTERPDEYVILSAHLDSWDGPGSEGASDNGTGSMVMLEAMRILRACQVRPRRTIRLVLWGGEEQGLLGSRAYVEKHRAELDKISAVFNDDAGSNYQGGLRILKEWEPFFAPLAEAINRAFPGMPFKLEFMETMSRGGGGSDHASFLQVGVPGLHWFETGRQDYRHVWHTQNDTFENAIPEYLVQSATNSALAAYLLSMNERLLPRPAPTPASGTPQ